MAASSLKKTGRLENLFLEIAAYLISWIYRLYYITVRVEVVNPQFSSRKISQKFNVIYVLWHSKSFLPLMICRKSKIATITLLDRKNVFFGKLCKRLGYQPIPVTNQDKAVLKLKTLLEQGSHATVVADGPAGQSGEKIPGNIKPGAAYLSVKSGKPIVAIQVQVNKTFRLMSRWDHYEIPFPFSRARVTFSEPMYVSERDIDSFEPKLRQALGPF